MQKRYGLARLKPTLRFLLFVAVSTVFTFAKNWPGILAAFCFGVFLLAAGRKFPKAAVIACFSAGLLTFLGNAFGAKQDLVIDFLLKASQESLLNGLRAALRIMSMILPAIAFIAVTPLHEFLEISRGLHFPPAFEMYLTIVLRYVDILWYEIGISMKAMAMRGVEWNGGAKEKVQAFSQLMLPLIFRIFEHVEGQSLAIDNRGGVRVGKSDQNVDQPTTETLKLDNVSVLYQLSEEGDIKPAVEDLSFSLRPGSTSVLLGPTGAGKTTTMLLSTGLIPGSSAHMKGQVSLCGQSTKDASMGFLGRNARIVLTSAVQGLVGLTVRDELLISLRVSETAKSEYEAAIRDALVAVGLDENFLGRMTLGLSGGEMQRVALASAIVVKPALLALDDVTMQLDPKGKREVISSLEKLSTSGTTRLLSDNNTALLEEVGGRFLSLQEGKLTGDEQKLTMQNLTASGLRLPQLWQLGLQLGLELSQFPEKAAKTLKQLAHKDKPAFTPAVKKPEDIAVKFENLAFSYNEGPLVLKKISSQVYKGEFVSILGSNGSGKTTLALILAGAMNPSGGKIWIDGIDSQAQKMRGKVGYIFQEPRNQMVTMTVLDELAFAPRQLKWNEEKVQQLARRELERFGLNPEDVPLRLQPSEARKVCIAATLTMNPDVVILDEPTNNLDSADVEQLMLHLKKLQAAGTTVVLISHDMDVVLEYSDRLIVMCEGNILTEGPTREVAMQSELLAKADVIMPAVVKTSLELWPDSLPCLTVDELAAQFRFSD
ncbi:MAG: ATP-binding cassette domain-containing protein [Anaerolineaceae bacterium]|nr:ATP-binding cassette domain-containing protein [Anaerolineaceae bacterium]